MMPFCPPFAKCAAAASQQALRQGRPTLPPPLVGTGFTRAEGESVGGGEGILISKLQKSAII